MNTLKQSWAWLVARWRSVWASFLDASHPANRTPAAFGPWEWHVFSDLPATYAETPWQDRLDALSVQRCDRTPEHVDGGGI